MPKYRVQVVVTGYIDVTAENEVEAERVAQDRYDDEGRVSNEEWTVLEACDD